MENHHSGLLLNLVPKLEPPDAEFVLCGEYVDGISNLAATPPDDKSCSDSFSGNTTGGDPIVCKDMKDIVKDCLQEIAAIKSDVKLEPEENIFDDSQNYDQINEQSTGYESSGSKNDYSKSNNPKTQFDDSGKKFSAALKRNDKKLHEMKKEKLNNDSLSTRKRRQRIPHILPEASPENILPPTAKRKRLTLSYQVNSSSENDSDESYNPELEFKAPGSARKKRKASKGKGTANIEMDKDKCTRNHQRSPHHQKPHPALQNFEHRSASSASIQFKTVEVRNCNKCKEKILDPKTRVLCAGKCNEFYHIDCNMVKKVDKFWKMSIGREGWKCDFCKEPEIIPETPKPASSKGKNVPKIKIPQKEPQNLLSSPVKNALPPAKNALPPAKNALPPAKNALPPAKNALPPTKNALPPAKNALPPAKNALPPTKNALPPAKNPVPPAKNALPPAKKKKENLVNKKTQRDAVLWFCCDLPFEQFSDFNAHKVKEHLTDELKCSVCVDQSFASLDEIEKHYLDSHAPPSSTSFHCSDCRIVFGVKSSFVDHQAKCPASKNVSSGILDSAENPQEVKVTEDTAYRLSCCEKIMESFEDFDVHKFSDHDIPLLTCGLCLCVKDTENQLKIHYKKFHFSKFWKMLKLENEPDNEDAASEMDDNDSDSEDCSRDIDEVTARPVQCSALQSGILCQCYNCTKVVENIQSVTTPAIQPGKPFHCAPCNLSFCYKSRLDKHLRTHAGVKRFPCDICGKAYTAKTSLNSHKLQRHSSNPLKVTCSICHKDLVSKSSLNIHIAHVHMHMNKNHQFKCNYCGKCYKHRKGLTRHIKSHHENNQVICDYCNTPFCEKPRLIEHILTMHLLNGEEYKCNNCDLVFKTKALLNSHKNNIHLNRQFNCEICGKIFKRNTLKTHMKVHSYETPFVCEICGKGFKRECNLQQHQYTHSDSRSQTCNICGQTFKLRTHLKQHMAVHGVIKNHHCHKCGKAFARKGELNRHLSTH